MPRLSQRKADRNGESCRKGLWFQLPKGDSKAPKGDNGLLKFLIDECLSPKLVELAIGRGFVASSHVVWIGKAGLKDWELKKIIVDEDWTFVTNNSIDFRGPSDKPGTAGQYADIFLHAGLICLNSHMRMNQAIQVDLFAAALDELRSQSQFVNEVLEVDLDRNGLKQYRHYSLPIQANSPPQ